MSFSNIISVGTFVLSGRESSTAWLRKPSVCTVGKLLSHAFAKITNNLNRHNDFCFNRCWSSRFCPYLVSLPLLCRRKVSNTFWSRDPQTSDTSLLMKGLLFSEPFAESFKTALGMLKPQDLGVLPRSSSGVCFGFVFITFLPQLTIRLTVLFSQEKEMVAWASKVMRYCPGLA